MYGDAEADVRWASQLATAQHRYDNMEPPDEPDPPDIDPEDAWVAIENGLIDYLMDKLGYSLDVASDAVEEALRLALAWKEKQG